MLKRRFSFTNTFSFAIWAAIVGVLGMGLPEQINLINGLNLSSPYGYFASHAAIAMLFYMLMINHDFTTDRPSFIQRIIRSKQIKKKRLMKYAYR